ncbi:MAG: peptidylprolyl isomerase [Acidiferrobacterales bacterium]
MGKLTVQNGSRVTLRLTLRVAGADQDAIVTHDGEPFTFTIGAGDLTAGLERRLICLRAGERRRFEIPCLEAYGPIEEGAVHSLPRTSFPSGIELQSGQVIGFEIAGYGEIPGTVVKVSAATVWVDFSHPLAGHDLIFDVEIINVVPQA